VREAVKVQGLKKNVFNSIAFHIAQAEVLVFTKLPLFLYVSCRLVLQQFTGPARLNKVLAATHTNYLTFTL
jgi:hypothetical protein